MTNPTTEPGLGGPAPASSGTDTIPDAQAAPSASAPASSFDDAMREAELRVAEAHNRQVVDREAERRRVHLETSAKLREVEKGSAAHFELLSLRQRWTLPLDDDDYLLFMQHQLLEQHGQAMADEVSAKRRERAKQMARGPAIVIAIVAGLATVAGIGWFLRGSTDRAKAADITAPQQTTETTPTEPTSEPTTQPATQPATQAATQAATQPGGAPQAIAPALPPTAAPATSEAAAHPPAAPSAKTPPATPGSARPAGAPPKPGAPKKDMWEREF